MDNYLKAYLYDSIKDIQSTIRSIDTKVGFIFIVLSIPFNKLDIIFNSCSDLINNSTSTTLFYINIFIVLFFSLSWLFAFVSTIRAIISIENPSEHIINHSEQSGSFYCGGLFKLCFIDVIFNRNSVKAIKDVRKHTESLPSSENEIINELAFEQIKLSYIRDIKSIRQKWAYKFATLWLSSGFLIYALNKLTSQ